MSSQDNSCLPFAIHLPRHSPGGGTTPLQEVVVVFLLPGGLVGVAVTGHQRGTRSGQVKAVLYEPVGTWPRWDTRGQMCDSPATGIDAAADVTRPSAARQLHSQVPADAVPRALTPPFLLATFVIA
ncbi:hypothetical protein E2C01_011590 [Portunus trituberculatus]|uniref:Uncharacterized protein n=1 Tax=Portunus trituberculatus TaxID=210409 RepID=A0A5B7DC88_PORTR|nr:hypothetical protein [Portunus trituberculatus]